MEQKHIYLSNKVEEEIIDKTKLCTTAMYIGNIAIPACTDPRVEGYYYCKSCMFYRQNEIIRHLHTRK